MPALLALRVADVTRICRLKLVEGFFEERLVFCERLQQRIRCDDAAEKEPPTEAPYSLSSSPRTLPVAGLMKWVCRQARQVINS